MAFSMGSGPSTPQMNVTPLIDVLLVLVIIFMLVVIQQKPAGLEAQIPQPAKPARDLPGPDQTIVIQVRYDPASDSHPLIKVNDEVVAWDQLRERLREIYAIRIERIAYVEADDTIDFQQVAEVIAIAKIAGVDRVGLMTEDGKHAPVTG
jgi:biopolymer transport protein TolR